MPELSEKSMQTLTEALAREHTVRYHLDSGEWVAARLLEKPELIKYLPPLLYALYRTWLQYCQDGHYSKLYQENEFFFRGRV